MPSQYGGYSNYDDSYADRYADRRNSNRSRGPIVRDVSDDQISQIRRRELASFYGEPAQSQSLVRYQTAPQGRYDNEDDDYFAQRRMVRRDRFNDDNDLPPTPDYRRTDPAYSQYNYRGDRYDRSQRRSSRRDATPPSDRGSNRDDRRRRRRGRAKSERRDAQDDRHDKDGNSIVYKGQLPQNKNKLGEQDEEGRLWYSAKDRSQASFMEKHFDSSYDGLFAGATGAIIGAMGVRRMVCVPGLSEEENKAISKKNRLKTIGGAVVGGLLFNAGENAFRVYTEEQSEYREHAMEVIEFGQECVDGLMPKM